MADRVPILHDFQQRSLIPIVQVEQLWTRGFVGKIRVLAGSQVARWRGVSELKACSFHCACFGENWKALLANRSSKLFELPLGVLQRRRCRVMFFESLWPR